VAPDGCTADKSVATSPLSSDGFAAGSLAAEETDLIDLFFSQNLLQSASKDRPEYLI
jgi:hypothetical protein